MKKRILIIPDVHGRTFWRTALDSGRYEKVIFLGDYVDPYAYEGIDNLMAISNFKDILSLKMIYPDQVILLLGNHDLCYLSDYYRDLAENDRYDYEFEEEIQQLFRGWSGYFKLAHEEKINGTRFLFSHAGVTMPWLKQNSKIIEEPDAGHLNLLLATKKGINTLAQVGQARCGCYTSGSIVWADCEELAKSNPLPDTYQVVGHTIQFDGPIIAEHFACLDCRAAFSIDRKGKINPVTEILGYEEYL